MKKIKLNAKFWDKASGVIAILIITSIVAHYVFDINIAVLDDIKNCGIVLFFMCEAKKWKILYEEEKQKSNTRETYARVPK